MAIAQKPSAGPLIGFSACSPQASTHQLRPAWSRHSVRATEFHRDSWRTGERRLNAVQRAIAGYHQDNECDWVAELSCGHDQHVRHRPPFEERPWVQSPAGRSGRLGKRLKCPLCDRAKLHANLRTVRTSPEWNERSLPAGLLRFHRLGSGIWGRIHVHDGHLQFSMASEPPFEHELDRGAEQAIPPEMDHEVRPVGSVRFSLDFLAVDRVGETRSGVLSIKVMIRPAGLVWCAPGVEPSSTGPSIAQVVPKRSSPDAHRLLRSVSRGRR